MADAAGASKLTSELAVFFQLSFLVLPLMRVARCPRVIQAPPCRPLRIGPQLMRRARAYSNKSRPNLNSKFGQLETLPDRLRENGFTMWKGFLTQQEVLKLE